MLAKKCTEPGTDFTCESRRRVEHSAHREVEAAEECDQAIYPKREKSLEKGTMTLPEYWG